MRFRVTNVRSLSAAASSRELLSAAPFGDVVSHGATSIGRDACV